ELEDGSKAVGFCNFGLEIAQLSYKDFAKLGISGKQVVRDLWRQKNVSVINATNGQLSLKVPVHGVVFYKFSPTK
ncbi:MAG: alpha-galactosidase, partial [Bacteroidota bacterium]|nr:alpha-galactosidase [Bacteroidota bacterium]